MFIWVETREIWWYFLNTRDLYTVRNSRVFQSQISSVAFYKDDKNLFHAIAIIKYLPVWKPSYASYGLLDSKVAAVLGVALIKTWVDNVRGFWKGWWKALGFAFIRQIRILFIYLHNLLPNSYQLSSEICLQVLLDVFAWL